MTNFCGLTTTDAVQLDGQFHLVKSVDQSCQTECFLQFRVYDQYTKLPVYRVSPVEICQTCVRQRQRAG
jgi:hypothetical protein